MSFIVTTIHLGVSDNLRFSDMFLWLTLGLLFSNLHRKSCSVLDKLCSLLRLFEHIILVVLDWEVLTLHASLALIKRNLSLLLENLAERWDQLRVNYAGLVFFQVWNVHILLIANFHQNLIVALIVRQFWTLEKARVWLTTLPFCNTILGISKCLFWFVGYLPAQRIAVSLIKCASGRADFLCLLRNLPGAEIGWAWSRKNHAIERVRLSLAGHEHSLRLFFKSTF